VVQKVADDADAEAEPGQVRPRLSVSPAVGRRSRRPSGVDADPEARHAASPISQVVYRAKDQQIFVVQGEPHPRNDVG